jgi:hypothetical protein
VRGFAESPKAPRTEKEEKEGGEKEERGRAREKENSYMVQSIGERLCRVSKGLLELLPLHEGLSALDHLFRDGLAFGKELDGTRRGQQNHVDVNLGAKLGTERNKMDSCKKKVKNSGDNKITSM